jgi:hypothetical protein
MRYIGIIGLIIGLAMLVGVAPVARGSGIPDQQQAAIGQTPPRLSFVDGQVGFWRPGAQGWTQAQVNTPLGPGDQLYTGSPGNLELQAGSRAFVRAWANTQIGLENQEPDFLQFRVTTGYAAFDLRTLEPGRTVQVDTPNAVFTIDHAGYYRVDVSYQRTSFIARRGGQASVAASGGESLAIAPSEEVVIEGATSPEVTAYAAPPLDEWDKWNYARTDQLLGAASARYVSPEIYGAGDLDSYGTWRILPVYGPVWVPTAVPPGWVPYSTGAWISDPDFGWTWVDTQPWGWAPCHYGRWVFVDGHWGWAPGPVVARPAYAPALVAFFGEPGVGASVAISNGPVVGWVALGWGEPLVPWWGPQGFIHRPWWGGWGGPHVVNNVVIKNTTVVDVQHIDIYRNAQVHNALVAVHENQFGRGPVASARIGAVDVKAFRPIHGAPRMSSSPANFRPRASLGIRPPEGNLRRTRVLTRAPHTPPDRVQAAAPGMRPAAISRPSQPAGIPRQGQSGPAPQRPPFGSGAFERPVGDRAYRPAPQAFEGRPHAATLSKAGPSVSRRVPPQFEREPQEIGPAKAVPRSPAGRPEGLYSDGRRLPGESAGRLSPYWAAERGRVAH